MAVLLEPAKIVLYAEALDRFLISPTGPVGLMLRRRTEAVLARAKESGAASFMENRVGAELVKSGIFVDAGGEYGEVFVDGMDGAASAWLAQKAEREDAGGWLVPALEEALVP